MNDGKHAAQYLLEQGIPCTALAATTDTCALTAMQVLQDAGYRVPDDLAVVGFDDILEAQYASPPLTQCAASSTRLAAPPPAAAGRNSRRARRAAPDYLGAARCFTGARAAARRWMILAGETTARDDSASWQTMLTRQLVQVVRYPLPLDPAFPRADLARADVLVAALDATLRGQPPKPLKSNMLAASHRADREPGGAA